MNKAVYYFCTDIKKDPVSHNVFQALLKKIPTEEIAIEIDGFKVLQYIDAKGDLFQFVRLQEVLSHNYPKYLPWMKEYFSDFDFAGLVNWHEGANAPERILTVHSTGDVPSGIFGASNPQFFKNLLVSIDKNRLKNGLNDFRTSTEATHWSGMPYGGNPGLITDYPVPMYDVEIGSCESSWTNEKAINVLASSLCEVFTSSCTDQLYTLLCVGGVHFEESFSTAILSENYPISIGHILPNQWLVSGNYDKDDDKSGLDRLEDSISSVINGVQGIVFHEGLKGPFKNLCRTVAEHHGVPVFKHKVLRDLDKALGILNGTIKM